MDRPDSIGKPKRRRNDMARAKRISIRVESVKKPVRRVRLKAKQVPQKPQVITVNVKSIANFQHGKRKGR